MITTESYEIFCSALGQQNQTKHVTQNYSPCDINAQPTTKKIMEAVCPCQESSAMYVHRVRNLSPARKERL